MNIFTPIKSNVRHNILRLLNDAAKESAKNDNAPNSLHEKEIILKNTPQKNVSIIEQLAFLKLKEEIKADEYDRFWILPKGIMSFLDEVHIKEGIKYRMDFIYDILKILAALTVVITFFRTVFWEYQNKIAIEALSSKLCQQENKVKALELLNIQLEEQNNMQQKLNKMNIPVVK